MPKTIVIIGGLSDDVDRDELLAELRERSGPDIEWDWIKAIENDGYNVPSKPMNRLLARLTSPTEHSEGLRVVKLFRLHGEFVAKLHRACRDPVLAPKYIDDRKELVEWVFSAEANLVPRHEWHANLEEAALVAILAKLVKNKSWNKNLQGHAWTIEENLLGQAPVSRPQFPEIAKEAAKMLLQLKGVLLLRKGGKQGKTPTEWSIRLEALPKVKQMIMGQSVAPLSAFRQLDTILKRTCNQDERPYVLNDDVVTERVRDICRAR